MSAEMTSMSRSRSLEMADRVFLVFDPLISDRCLSRFVFFFFYCFVPLLFRSPSAYVSFSELLSSFDFKFFSSFFLQFLLFLFIFLSSLFPILHSPSFNLTVPPTLYLPLSSLHSNSTLPSFFSRDPGLRCLFIFFSLVTFSPFLRESKKNTKRELPAIAN